MKRIIVVVIVIILLSDLLGSLVNLWEGVLEIEGVEHSGGAQRWRSGDQQQTRNGFINS